MEKNHHKELGSIWASFCKQISVRQMVKSLVSTLDLRFIILVSVGIYLDLCFLHSFRSIILVSVHNRSCDRRADLLRQHRRSRRHGRGASLQVRGEGVLLIGGHSIWFVFLLDLMVQLHEHAIEIISKFLSYRIYWYIFYFKRCEYRSVCHNKCVSIILQNWEERSDSSTIVTIFFSLQGFTVNEFSGLQDCPVCL